MNPRRGNPLGASGCVAEALSVPGAQLGYRSYQIVAGGLRYFPSRRTSITIPVSSRTLMSPIDGFHIIEEK